jgi:hypothetical protein
MKVLKHLSNIQYGCGMQSAWGCSLNHDNYTTKSFGHTHTPFAQKLTPPAQRHDGYGHTHTSLHSITTCWNTLYISNMDVRWSQWGVAASTIWHHNVNPAQPYYPIQLHKNTPPTGKVSMKALKCEHTTPFNYMKIHPPLAKLVWRHLSVNMLPQLSTWKYTLHWQS